MATNKGYSIRNFEEWKNGGQNGGSSQTTANSNSFGEPQHTTSNKYSVQSFEEWRQNRTSGVTPGGSRLDEMDVGSSLESWIDRYNRTMNSLSGSTTGRWYGVDAINRYGREVNDLVNQFDSIKDYAFVYGFQDTLPHYQNLKKIQEAINHESGWYEKYRGRGHEDIEQILSAMKTGDERDWLEASRYDVYKTAPDYQQRSQTGLAAFENSKPKDQEEESWFEAIGRYLGKASDTTMALGDTGRMSQEYRKDTKYKEPAENWTEDQRNTYGYLYSINPEAASDFAVKTSENYRRAENQQKLGAIQEWATKNGKNATAGTVAAIAMMPLSLADTLNALTEYNARGTISTPSSPTPGQVSEAITGAVGQSLNDKHGTISSKIPVIGGKGWGDAYQLGTSIANSLLSAYTQGSIGTDILFFGSSAASTMHNKKQQGATDEQAIKMGVLAGLAEAAGEHFSIEGLINMNEANTMKAFFCNVLKQSGIEASEEGFTTLMNNFADQLIMGKDSAFYEKVRTYMSENGMSEQEAKKQAWKDMAEDLAFDMVGGAISGGVSTGIQTGAQKIFGGTEQAQTHHEPLATEKPGNATELANNEENATADSLGAVADKMSPTVGVSKMETVQVKPDMDSFAQQFGTQADAVKRNYLEGQDLQEYEVGFQTAYAMGLEGGKQEALGAVPYLSQSQREIAFSLGRDAAAAQKAAAPKKAAVTAKMTTEEGTQDVTIAEVVDMDDTTMTFRLEDGRTVTDNDLDFETGQLLMSAVWETGMDVNSANAIIKASAANTAADADQAVGIQQAYHYGQQGYTMEQLTKHGTDAAALTDGQRKAAWEAGRKIYLQKAGAVPGGGMKVSGKTAGVWFDAGGGNVRSFDDADLSGLSEAAVAGARAAQVLQKLGIGKNYYFYESYVNKAGERVYKDENGQERKAPNGWYDPDGSIHIDLNAGAEGKGLTMYTLSHELTHFVERWSPKKYQALADFLVANYAKAGNVDAMVAEKQAELSAGRGSEVSYEEAYSEFIADSMEAMLSDGNVLEKLQELKKTDRSLFDKIREFFDNLARKIREIYKDLTPDTLEGQTVLQMKGQIDQIQQLFAEALVEAGENFQAVAEIGLEVDMETESVSPAVLYSERTWKESDYVQERNKAAQEISKAIDVTEKKARQYIDSVNSIAKMIAEDRTRLDYFSSPGRSSFIGNVEYGGSFDFSTLCKKRRLLTGTFTAIQKALPNTALTANEILDIRNRMKDAGLEVSCGLCYVEGSRANMGQFAKEFLRLYKQYYPDAWQPNMADVNTPDGIEWVRINHPECYEQYEYFWNHYGTLKAGDKNLFASQQKPKLYQLHTEYKGEILQKFKGDDNVEEKNLNGGIRLQSFSDFEIVHLIDTMQIIMDMSRVGLAGQAYTKVPDFAWALGDTGLKINLSLIAKGVDESGNLIFDDIEGMPIAEAMKLRDRYSANVGTILVAFNDAQLMAAMADDRVDFIIPFHRSQWKKSQYEAMGLPAKTKDYTYMQNEKFIKPQYHEYRGRMVRDKATNYMPNEYWDFSKSGKENAEAYLEMCARNNKRPKFYKLLQNNGDGSYSLKADGSTDGYWKLLIDFKMYDNEGNGSPQMPVRPDFNMEESARMMREYKGGHSNFPVAQGIVDAFVQEYKQDHPGRQFSDRKKAVDNSTLKEENEVRNEVRGDNYDNGRIRKGTETGAAGSGNDRRADPGSAGNAPQAAEWRSLDGGVKRKVRSVIKQHLNSSPNINEALSVIYSFVNRTDETITPYTDRKAMEILADKLYSAAMNDHPVIFESNWAFMGGKVSDLQKKIRSASGTERQFSDRQKAPTFYSYMDTVVAGMKQEKFGAASVVNMLRGKGVKAEEIKWSGIEAWLEGKKSVTKAELQEFITGSMLQIEEENHSGGAGISIEPAGYTMDGESNNVNVIRGGEVIDFLEWDDFNEHYVSDALGYSFFNEDEIIRYYSGGEDNGDTRWGEYKLDGGENYREIIFRLPEATYTNSAMQNHWGSSAEGILAHARMQDFDTEDGKMLFIEEIQSDWHNAGHKYGYANEFDYAEAAELKDQAELARSEVSDAYVEYKKVESEYHKILRDFGMASDNIEQWQHRIKDAMEKTAKASLAHDHARTKFVELQNKLQTLGHKAPDAPFQDNYHEFVLKRLIREAAEQGYDAIGWTPSDLQVDRWSEQFAEGYRIEYDQEIPKFLRKYGKKWGATVGRTTLPGLNAKESYYDVNIEETFYDIEDWKAAVKQTVKEQGGKPKDIMFWNDGAYWVAYDQKSGLETDRVRIQKTSDTVWFMPITQAMKDSVLYEGQVMYQARATGTSNRALLAGAFEELVTSPDELEFIRKYQENIAHLNEQEAKLQEIRTEIREISFGKGPRDTKRLQQLQEEATKTANRIDIYDKKLLKLERAKPLRDVLDREREKVRKATRQKGQEVLENYREKRKESAARKDARRKIRKTVFELDKLLNRGDKKKNVKDGMSSMVGSVLKLADALFMDEYSNRDMLRNGVGVELTDAEEKLFREAQQILQQTESGAAIEGMEFTSEVDAMNQLKKMDQKLSSKMAGLKDVFARERKRLYGTTVSDLLGKLADEYSRLSEAEDGAVRAAKDENVYAHLLQLQKDVGGTTVRDMTLGQMEAVADAFTMVLTTVRNANKMFAKNLKFKRDTLAAMVMGEIGAAVKKISKLIRPGKNAIDSFSWNNLKPVYAFERLGSETLKTLYQNIRSGQDVWSRDMQEADAFRREQYRKHNRKAWDLEKQHRFEFESGIVELSLEQIMSLYAYSRREQALDHLLKGGFVFSGSTEVMVKEHGIQRRYLKKDATAYNLTADELLQVVDTLTKEQKAFVEEMQTYLSDVMGGKGNEISLQMYGIRSYGEKNYFPIRSAGQYMERAKEDSFRKEQGQISIVNSGFTKSTTPKANNPITLDGFMNVWAEHVNDMSMYHGFALPMEDFRRVYNYSSPNMEVGNSQSVNAVIENAFGKAATGYIDQLYKDLNGGAVSDNRENLSKKLVGLHKKAAVFASASVVVQQPSAIVRAFALIDPRHFIGPKVDRKRYKQLWEEVKKYAPVAFVKEMGYFDTGMGRSARDFLQAEEYSDIREKMTALFKDADYRDEILGKAPALADELTWCSIWEAVKRETNAKNPDLDVRSDAFLQMAGSRFSEVIDKTQVYDSVLSRSANMRSKSGLMNMVTSFLAEPTTSINMLEDALRKGDRQQLKRTVGAVYGSVLLNSLLVSLVYAARDDDEDETWWEKYLSHVAVEMTDGINPITYYPFLRDIWSIGQGFDVERADMSLITDFADAAKKVVQSILKVQQAEADEQPAAIGALKDSLWGMTDTVASLTGLPLKNIRRDIEGARNVVRTIQADLNTRDTTGRSLMDAVLGEVMNSIPIGGLLYSKNKRDRLYGALVAGDAAYVQRLKAGYESDSAYHSAIKMALRDNDSRIWEAAVAWNEGRMDAYIWIAKEIRSENRFDQDDIVLAIRAEANSMLDNESGGSDKVYGYFTSEKFGVAIAQNNTAMADMIRKDLIDTAMANGKTREAAEESVRSTARTQLKQLYADGTITGMNAEKMLVKYGEYDREDAADKVAEWKYEKDHPELDGMITYSQYKRWEADGKNRGVDLDTFTDVAEFRGGNTSAGVRSQDDVAAYINSMPITTAQKDALWCCFWSESTLHKNAPWH